MKNLNTNTVALAKLTNLRQGPRKVRLVAALIKKLSVTDAEKQLQLAEKRPAGPLLTLLRSAIANAKNKGVDASDLVIESITVGEGETLHRIMPRAFGRAYGIKQRASHVTLKLAKAKN